MNIKIWKMGQWENEDVDPDDLSNGFDEDGYCTCSRCQSQKKHEIEKKIASVMVPDEMFEL